MAVVEGVAGGWFRERELGFEEVGAGEGGYAGCHGGFGGGSVGEDIGVGEAGAGGWWLG